jgi:molybdate transport system substrate-binding protein
MIPFAGKLPAFSVMLVCAIFLEARAPALAAAEPVAVAAAANLVYALAPLDEAFAKSHPEIAVRREMGASGNLVVQIENGAPYDVFLSADTDFPKQLIKAGGADAASLVVFAVGKLALWTAKAGLSFDSVDSAVHNPSVRRLAIANPRTAPYGRAAQEALAKLGLTAEAGPKLVVGENISQAAEYVETGNADAGFVAMSLVLSPKLKNRGTWIEGPQGLYDPIEQGAVITKRGASNAAAKTYIEFLRGPEAREIFKRFGYGVPN